MEKEFDPNLHEAIMREDLEEYAEDIVTMELQRGFAIGDKLLRPAMVHGRVSHKTCLGP